MLVLKRKEFGETGALIGGALGARKNARERLSKKSKIERSEKKKD